MAVLVDKKTRVVVQGITGSAGSFHTQAMRRLRHASRGRLHARARRRNVRSRRPGRQEGEIPVFDTVAEAVKETGADTSCIFVPALGAGDAILEAADAGCTLVICITEGIPVMDMIRVRRALEGKQSRLIGPNCPGVITPGECKIGIMPGHIHKPGQDRRRLALRHPHLRGRRAAHGARNRTEHMHRHRRRSGQRDGLRRCALAFQRRPGHRRRDHDRRDRRQRRGARRRVHQGQHEEARRRASSPGRPRRPASAWATRARSSAAARAPRRTRSWL